MEQINKILKTDILALVILAGGSSNILFASSGDDFNVNSKITAGAKPNQPVFTVCQPVEDNENDELSSPEHHYCAYFSSEIIPDLVTKIHYVYLGKQCAHSDLWRTYRNFRL